MSSEQTELCPHGRLTTAYCGPCAEKAIEELMDKGEQINWPEFQNPNNWEVQKTGAKKIQNFEQLEGGGSSYYYDLPDNCRTLQDIIYYKQMGFSRGNIFKAAYRWGLKPNVAYNLEKIIWFASYELEKVSPGSAVRVATSAAEHSNVDLR